MDRRQIIELYMAMGGIPHYLKEVEHGLSTAQNIENICFRRSGLLYDEYQKLFISLFDDAEKHHELIHAIGWQNAAPQNWQAIQKSPAWNSWSGYAFEAICMKHIEQIKQALSIAGIASHEYSWVQHPTANKEGAQIDLLIDRADGCINVCEIKFSRSLYAITKAYAARLQKRNDLFAEATNHQKTQFLTIVTPKGVTENASWASLTPICINAEEVLFQ